MWGGFGAYGSRIDPDLYDVAQGTGSAVGGALIGGPPEWVTILRYLTFTNEVWFSRAVISTGAPFWSLGFEAAYYVAFAIALYGRGASRWIWAGLWLLLCGPRIAMALPLWLVGVAAWRTVMMRPSIAPGAGWASLVGLGGAAVAWRRWQGVAAVPLFEWPPTGALIASMAYYLELAVLVASMIVVFAAVVPQRPIWPSWLERVIRYSAGASFTLYIAHLPLMVLILAIWPATVGSTGRAAVAVFVTVIATFALAALGERRKSAYGRIYRRVVQIFRIPKNFMDSAID